MSTSLKDVDSSLEKLSLAQKQNQGLRTPPSSTKKSIADSWDDEISSDEEPEIHRPQSNSGALPGPPPPTPVSPLSPQSQRQRDVARNTFTSFPIDDHVRGRSGSPPGGARARPEKTDAVAKRLIAGALGVRAPKKTEEQKEYEKAVRDKEMRKRDQEREAQKKAKEDEAKAKAAIWED
ncbi:MAG: hypothetical protein M1817_006915 [Caeruleum heppii]|nr:MAG: hypothetical protein M1817_006915 [Caeruleum heppii]